MFCSFCLSKKMFIHLAGVNEHSLRNLPFSRLGKSRKISKSRNLEILKSRKIEKSKNQKIEKSKNRKISKNLKILKNPYGKS